MHRKNEAMRNARSPIARNQYGRLGLRRRLGGRTTATTFLLSSARSCMMTTLFTRGRWQPSRPSERGDLYLQKKVGTKATTHLSHRIAIQGAVEYAQALLNAGIRRIAVLPRLRRGSSVSREWANGTRGPRSARISGLHRLAARAFHDAADAPRLGPPPARAGYPRMASSQPCPSCTQQRSSGS